MLNPKIVELFGVDWSNLLQDILTDDYFTSLANIIAIERMKTTVYPESPEIIFRAFRETSLESLKVVILGQDPYHDGSADGLAFSNGGKKHPSPSLKNIIQELENCYGNTKDLMKPEYYDLTHWAKQGVLLLNASLTVQRGKPSSDSLLWEPFTRHVIKTLGNSSNTYIFLLWGKAAQEYIPLIDPFLNTILTADHPVAPVYGNKKLWFGNKHFLKVNELLTAMNGKEACINWIIN
jgi:uracil-DNA glycosylase